MTEEEWHLMLGRINERAAELTELAKTFKGPGEAALAFMATACACADLIPEFDAIAAFRMVYEAQHEKKN